ncbi:septin 7 [Nematocida minor]|uniref:septin 7 n=1 Tax=Nematocida minor TaxID=1912983 RepID=UPI00221ED473|nr:septin 7 [Nematocida minor]KAI5189227.1 septin 7 [Nematocida minor]
MDRTGQLLNTLPGQIVRSIEDTPVSYNVIVMGESYSGKSSLISSLFSIETDSELIRDDTLFHEVCDMACTNNPLAELMDTEAHCLERNNTSISATRYILNESGIKMNLTVYEIGGIGDSVNSSYDWVPAKNLVLNRYEEYHMEEDHGQLKEDKRIHACLYLISPTDVLREIDVLCMYEMGKITNLIPIISKSDMLTEEKYREMKEAVCSHLISRNVQLFDSICVDECKKVVELNFLPLKFSTPGRVYPYGTSSENDADVCTLRDLLISQHLVDLKEVTDGYYETYRRNKLIVEILIVKDSGISEDFQRRMELEEAKAKKLAKKIEEKKASYQILIAQHKNAIPKELL